MRAGALNKILTLQNIVEVSDAYGDNTISYVDVKTTRGSFNPITGNESYINPQILNTVSHKMEIRYDNNITLTPKDRVIFNGRKFDIEYIINFQEKNEKLMLLVIERLNEV